jgi:hypothetical protein
VHDEGCVGEAGAPSLRTNEAAPEAFSIIAARFERRQPKGQPPKPTAAFCTSGDKPARASSDPP